MSLNVVLRGLVVTVLASGPRFAGLSQAEGDGFLTAIKIRSTPSFGGEVKPSVPCHEILRYIKGPFEVRKRYFVRQNSFPSPVHPALLLDVSACRIAIELWWTTQKYSRVYTTDVWFSMLMCHTGNEQWTFWWPYFVIHEHF
jgi:hypothetical protein